MEFNISSKQAMNIQQKIEKRVFFTVVIFF